jgi:hypothetical protein
MQRRDSSFKISKQTKRAMTTILDKDRRNVFKESMIKAQIDGSKHSSTKKNKETVDAS